MRKGREGKGRNGLFWVLGLGARTGLKWGCGWGRKGREGCEWGTRGGRDWVGGGNEKRKRGLKAQEGRGKRKGGGIGGKEEMRKRRRREK